MQSRVVLILGGTSEARALATSLVAAGCIVTSSLAGRVRNPALPEGQVRIGGFGGVGGLEQYLRHTRPDAVVDATHPFAATISASAATVCARLRVPLVRLARPGWADHPDASAWVWVESMNDAAVAVQQRGLRVLLTTGRTTLAHFASLAKSFVLVRLVEPTADPLPVGWDVIYSRGPYTVSGEYQLMTSHRIDLLIAKDSGGSMTEPKLTAAAMLGVRVVMINRPASARGVPEVMTVPDATRWVISDARVIGGAGTDR